METILVVLNRNAGHDDAAAAEAGIRAALEEDGRPFELLKPGSPAQIRAALLEACARHRGPGILVAAGGDGTLNTVATVALETGWTLGVVPLGTYNYFARDLGLPVDPGEAMRAVLTGRPRRVHVGRVNGRLFLVNASFGLYRRLLQRRERLKRRFGRYRLVAMAAALTGLWRFDRSYRVELEIDGRREQRRTPMVFFGLNSLQLENLELAVAGCAAAGRLALIIPRTSSRLRLLLLALKAAARRIEGSPEVECHCASRVLVRWPGHSEARVAIDGETVLCELPLTVEVLPSVLPVLAPSVPEPRA